jgi:hypothetical protein
MRQMMGSVADGVLNLFLPKARAGACQCTPDPYPECECRPTNGFGYVMWCRTCTYNCACVVNCGAYAPTNKAGCH